MVLLPEVMWKGCSPPCFPCWSSHGEQLGELGAEITPGLPTPACSCTLCAGTALGTAASPGPVPASA